MDVIKNLEDFINAQSLKVRQRVRNKAIKKAETNLIYNGTKQEDLSLEDWENVVAEEEKAIWESYKKYPLWAFMKNIFFGSSSERPSLDHHLKDFLCFIILKIFF